MKVAVLTISALMITSATGKVPASTNCMVGLVSESWKAEPFAFVKNADGTMQMLCTEASVLATQINERHYNGVNPVKAIVLE